MSEAERIVAAAIRHEGQTYSLLPPARHGEVLRLVMAIHQPSVVGLPDDQGFVTSYNRFVGRKEGKLIARDAGQLLPTASPSTDLFSEDLW